ncbi:MAG TPA: alpha/beta fold hydrolase [Puia sp.]|uniref:alpha/beta fold hydrolase n=1 Tax=Puia sp. TaxID=2045100 RepID=UPI002CFC279F|nr:alpha/beta fold hydrolase [Puia sp.]HVU97896.1 alpha/beta fold hydrolase [Puia sp.]
MPTKQIRGIALAYDDFGPAGTRPLVFIHGHPFNRSMWAGQVAHLQNDFRLILPDLRGYGGSGVTTPRVLLDEMALDIIHLLDELNITNATFIGLSMGGQIVLDLWRLIPHRFNGMVIVDSDARAETSESAARRLATAEEIIKVGMVRHTDETIHRYIAKASMDNPNVYEPLYKMMSTTNPEGAAAAHRGRAIRRDHTDILKNIAVPALIVAGSEDFFTPTPIAKLMSDNIPGAQLAVIDGAGHLPNMEATQEFNRRLEQFLSDSACIKTAQKYPLAER